MPKLSTIRTGNGDDGFTYMASGGQVCKSNKFIKYGNTIAQARNSIIVWGIDDELLHKFINQVSWEMGACLSLKCDATFTDDHRNEILGKIADLGKLTLPDFTYSYSVDWGLGETATTWVRQAECEMWELEMCRLARYLNPLADYLFILNVLRNTPHPIKH